MKRFLVSAAAITALSITAVASASTASSWLTVGRASDSNDFWASASIYKSNVHRVRKARVIVRSGGRHAHVRGDISCMRGFNFGSRSFSFRTYGGRTKLKLPLHGGTCDFLIDAELRHGGTISFKLQIRR